MVQVVDAADGTDDTTDEDGIPIVTNVEIIESPAIAKKLGIPKVRGKEAALGSPFAHSISIYYVVDCIETSIIASHIQRNRR